MAKRRFTKSQIQIAMLGALLLVIAGVLVYFASKGSGSPSGGYAPKEVETEIPSGVFSHPVYQRLESPVSLPVRPAQTGREDPFASF